ncbi:hypothetical protein [Demequina aurantiaca]|uniref:hypothetical protein n=1 Tax=Demequina aurantiaca TaxID=676200 RepID=UPI000782021E|nr:hypothetical protein [Demequina aurantiaca]
MNGRHYNPRNPRHLTDADEVRDANRSLTSMHPVFAKRRRSARESDVEGPGGVDVQPTLFSMADHPGGVPSAMRAAAAAGTPRRADAPLPHEIAFDSASDALRQVTTLNMTTSAYRMALKRALMMFRQVQDIAPPGFHTGRVHRAIETLSLNLETDWRRVIEVELRYADNSTEFVNVKLDPEAARKFQEATQFRLVSTE